VRLELVSQPESLTLVRGALTGIGDTLAFEQELLDDVKTAVSEACNNVILHAYPDGFGPMWIAVRTAPNEVDVTVHDRGTGIHGVTSAEDRMGVGLAVISALAERAEFVSAPDRGTEVRMAFRGEIGRPMDGAGEMEPLSAEEPDPPNGVDGDVVASVSPTALLAGVLGRLARGLAGAARFSVDRLSDLYLIVDTLAGHADTWASNDRIAFGLSAVERRMELVIGPFRMGSSVRLKSAGRGLAVLADEVIVKPTDESEIVRLVVSDSRSR
jgi:anti-sigma regulatory factor (Ser/Thr protein kinase)